MAVASEYAGDVVKLGDDINTDVIFPGRYILVMEPEEMRKHVLEGLGEDYARRIKPGDFIVAGRNFGCGSSREQAAGCLKAAGVAAVIAGSFARIFYRNAVNTGLLVLACPEAVDAIADGDKIAVRPKEGRVTLSDGRTFRFPPLPDFLMEIIEAGGLVEHGRKVVAARKAALQEQRR